MQVAVRAKQRELAERGYDGTTLSGWHFARCLHGGIAALRSAGLKPWGPRRYSRRGSRQTWWALYMNRRRRYRRRKRSGNAATGGGMDVFAASNIPGALALMPLCLSRAILYLRLGGMSRFSTVRTPTVGGRAYRYKQTSENLVTVAHQYQRHHLVAWPLAL